MDNTPSTDSAVISLLLDDYPAWFSQVLRGVFYKENEAISADASKIVFPPLISEMPQKPPALDLLTKGQEDLHKLARAVLALPAKPDLLMLDHFLQSYEGVVANLQRLEVDSTLSGFGIDRLTGLRSATAMIADLERELERRARRGQPFAIVLCRIDQMSEENKNVRLQKAAEALKICIRNFDDAYVSGENEFLASLKHSDAAGGLKFIERLKKTLERIEADFTMSYCSAEPMPGDNLQDLISNVRLDLLDIAGKSHGGEAVKYEDVSPLQRYVHSLKQKSDS
jgi:diguanylate cyclase